MLMCYHGGAQKIVGSWRAGRRVQDGGTDVFQSSSIWLRATQGLEA
jgi:hypothetical protein